MRHHLLVGMMLLGLAVLLLTAGVVLAQSGGYDLSWWTVDGGGITFATGGTYNLGATAGQPDAGTLSGGAYTLDGGFWGGVRQAPIVYLPTVMR
jgi:hypothetical protein